MHCVWSMVLMTMRLGRTGFSTLGCTTPELAKKLKKVYQTKSKKSEILLHQTLSYVWGSCQVSSKNNIRGALTEKNKIAAESFVHCLSSDFFLWELLRCYFWIKLCKNLKHIVEIDVAKFQIVRMLFHIKSTLLRKPWLIIRVKYQYL